MQICISIPAYLTRVAAAGPEEPAFPATSVIDTFSGTDGDTLPVYSPANWASPTGSNLTIQSSQIAHSTSATNNWVSSFNANSELYITITTKPADGEETDLWLRIPDPPNLFTTADGYLVSALYVAGTDTIAIARWTNNVGTTIDTTSQEVSTNDSIGLRCYGDNIRGYYKSGAGPWTEILTAADDTYNTSGYLCIYCSGDANGRLDNLGGGSV